MTPISVIIPSFNEEAKIGDVIQRIQTVLADAPHEILVINDGSTDQTAANATAAGAIVVSHPYNIGNGAAVKTGIRHAKGDILVMLDIQCTFEPLHRGHKFTCVIL